MQKSSPDMMLEIWHLEKKPAASKRGGYSQHVEALLAVNKELLEIEQVSDVFKLLTFVKGNGEKSLQDISRIICLKKPSWLSERCPDEAALAAISLAMQIWLFTPIDLKYTHRKLDRCVETAVLKVHLAGGASTLQRLSSDFSEKSLTRVGGITMVRTSNLLEHLTFDADSCLRIFNHALALCAFDDEDLEEHNFFPAGFLSETRMTLRLLSRPHDIDSWERNKKLGRRHRFDLESGNEQPASLDLDNYPFWRHRLAMVQERYNAARPGALKQWWYDRRNKQEWATFWIAVIIFVLTVVFGLISSITAIMQVYAAFHVAS